MPDALPHAQPTVSKHWRQMHIHTSLTKIFQMNLGWLTAPWFSLFSCSNLMHPLRRDQNLSYAQLTSFHHVFLRHPLCLIPSTSNVVQYLIRSVPSLHFTCPNRLHLPFTSPYWCTHINASLTEIFQVNPGYLVAVAWGHGSLVITCLTVVWEDSCLNLITGSCGYHNSHCNIPPWAWTAHP